MSPLSTELCGYLVSATAEMIDDAHAMTLMLSATLIAASVFSLLPVFAANIELLDDVLHQAVLRGPVCASTPPVFISRQRGAIRSLSPERGAKRSSLSERGQTAARSEAPRTIRSTCSVADPTQRFVVESIGNRRHVRVHDGDHG